MNKYKKESRLARMFRKIAKTCLPARQVCLNKKAFETEEEAFQQGQRIYQCKHCGK